MKLVSFLAASNAWSSLASAEKNLREIPRGGEGVIRRLDEATETERFFPNGRNSSFYPGPERPAWLAAPQQKYELVGIQEVKGRQGVAATDEFYYVSGSLTLHKYTKNWTLVSENLEPFTELEKPANHFGDISYYNGEIYTGIEWFEDGRGQDIQIAIYDAETLEFKRTYPWSEDSGMVEVSAIAVDPKNSLVWMTEWVNGDYLYKYELETGEYVGKVHLLPSPQWQQGLAVYNDTVWFTADDGNTDRLECDNLWSVPADRNSTIAYVRHEHAFDDFKDIGEIEGVDFDESTGELLVHNNRGKRIVLGMPKGLYGGYEKEISEVYTFKLDPNRRLDEATETERFFPNGRNSSFYPGPERPAWLAAPQLKYELVGIQEVKGRQGVAATDEFYYVSGSLTLHKYTKNWTLVSENLEPFTELEKPANHFGDISYYNGEIYTGIEWFEDGRGQDIQIAIYDAETLEFKRTYPWSEDSGMVEVSAIAVDPKNSLVWMTEWVNGDYLYKYELETGEYVGKVHLLPSPQWQQGLAVYNDTVWFTADDGNTDRLECDNLWSVPADRNSTIAYVRHEHAFDDFKDIGEIEGVDFDESTGELLVHNNRGKRIVLGMPKGLYGGYEKEISEVYTFKLSPGEANDASGGSDESSDGSTSSGRALLAGTATFHIILSVVVLLTITW